jgi:hypothetical protein
MLIKIDDFMHHLDLWKYELKRSVDPDLMAQIILHLWSLITSALLGLIVAFVVGNSFTIGNAAAITGNFDNSRNFID